METWWRHKYEKEVNCWKTSSRATGISRFISISKCLQSAWRTIEFIPSSTLRSISCIIKCLVHSWRWWIGRSTRRYSIRRWPLYRWWCSWNWNNRRSQNEWFIYEWEDITLTCCWCGNALMLPLCITRTGWRAINIAPWASFESKGMENSRFSLRIIKSWQSIIFQAGF